MGRGDTSKYSTWRHGLDDPSYEALLEKQYESCAICGKTDVRLVIDHDHDCCPGGGYLHPNCGMCVRGLLCFRCNNLIGYIESTPDPILRKAFDYIAGKNPRSYKPRQLDPLRLVGGSKVA